jgi:2-keto-4-pentenoate hydratase
MPSEMTQDQKQAACKLLYDCWRGGTQIEALAPSLRPHDRSEGYAIQGFIEHYSSQPLFGWKIAATNVAGQTHIGVAGPLAGRLLAERIIADGGVCPLASNLMRVAELEFAFRMEGDIAPRSHPYEQNEILDRVGTLHPAIEIPDSRFLQFERAGEAQLIADNACAHRFVLGPSILADWRALDLAAHRASAILNGNIVGEGSGANVLGDPRIALTWCANELSRLGITLKAGQVVTTGTCVKPIPIGKGDHVAGDFGVLGRVSVSIG